MNNLDRNDYKLAPRLKEEEDPETLNNEAKTITKAIYITTLLSVVLSMSAFYFE